MKTNTLPQAAYLQASAAGPRSAPVSGASCPSEDDDGAENAALAATLATLLHRAILVCNVTFCLAFIFLIAWQIHRSFPGN